MTPDILIKKTKRQTVSLSITKELSVLIRAPLWMSDSEISGLLTKHKKWIDNHIVLQKKRNEKAGEYKPTEAEKNELRKKARKLLSCKVRRFSEIMGVTPMGITITCARTRWGSCSGKNSLSFPFRIVLLPDNLIDYIVVHELSHIRVKNHSPAFYREVGKYMPDYKLRIAELKKLQKDIPQF
ncbi:MAG: M48 family metallopeptidase [Bacillota bacterium]|nr:M48 family metallopeptidase [Bacillota bacterium]